MTSKPSLTARKLPVSYRVNVTLEARREIKALPGYVRAQARKLVRALGLDPRPHRAKELREKPNVYRIWLAGRWRIAYAINDGDQIVHILRVRRKEFMAYEHLDGSDYIHEGTGQSGHTPPVSMITGEARRRQVP